MSSNDVLYITDPDWLRSLQEFNSAYRWCDKSVTKQITEHKDDFKLSDVHPNVFHAFLLLYDNSLVLHDIYYQCIKSPNLSYGRVFYGLLCNVRPKDDPNPVRYDIEYRSILKSSYLKKGVKSFAIDHIIRCITDFKCSSDSELKEKICPVNYIDSFLDIISVIDPKIDSKLGYDPNFKNVIDMFDITEDNLTFEVIPRAIKKLFEDEKSINICLLKNLYFNVCCTGNLKGILKDKFGQFMRYELGASRKICVGDNMKDISFVDEVFDVCKYATKYSRNFYIPNYDAMSYIYVTTKIKYDTNYTPLNLCLSMNDVRKDSTPTEDDLLKARLKISEFIFQ